MTNPPHPGQPPYPPGEGGHVAPGMPPHPGDPRQARAPYDVPVQRTPDSAPDAVRGPGGPFQGQLRPPSGPEYMPARGTDQSTGGGASQKGVVGALMDVNFNAMVTPKLIRIFYVLALMMVSLSALSVAAIGLWVFELRNGWFLGGIIICAAPVIWLFEALMVRIFMEAIIVRFKTTEYLQAIKDKI